jgi:hypothetical protein
MIDGFRNHVRGSGGSREVFSCSLRSEVLVCGSHSEVVYKCPFCVCVFSTFLDLEFHLNAFLRVGSFHREAWRKELVRRDREWGALVPAGNHGFRRSKKTWFSDSAALVF